jgi:CubicO group peptidase (beta-lactamase class C family)
MRLHRTHRLRIALLAAGLAGGCGGAPAGPDARLADGPGADAPAPPTGLRARVDAIMGPAFASTPSDLAQCIGGVAVIVTPTEELVDGWGATVLGGATRPGADTLFQVGSLTKAFTGLGLARLVGDGVVTLEATPGELLASDLRDAAASWPTLGALVTHHAGLPAFPANLVDRDGDGVRDPELDPRSPAAGYDRLDLRAALTAWTPPPSPAYAYSNVGIGLLGLALQDHLGLASHDATLRRLVTEDLAMLDTWGEVAAVPAAVGARLATGHVVDGDARAPGILAEMGVLASAGEVVTSGADLRRFLRAVTGLDATPLAPAIARATAPLADGPAGRQVGYALELETVDGVARYRKGGNTPSYAAHLLWSTQPAVGVAVVTNCGGFLPVIELAEALHDAARAP